MENDLDATAQSPNLPSATPKSLRQRSARRLRHEAQIDVWVKKVGSLEDIRRQLGMRPAQICDLLKVHPSAWIRWVRVGKAPPYVYQMLEWYLELSKWRLLHDPFDTSMKTIGQGPQPSQAPDETTLKPTFPDLTNIVSSSEIMRSQELTLKKLRWALVLTWVMQAFLTMLFIFVLRTSHS